MSVKQITERIHRRHARLHTGLLLEFDDLDVERSFLRADDAAGVRSATFAVWVGLALHTAYAVAEPLLFDEGVVEAFVIRIVTGWIPFLAAIVALRMSPWWREHIQQGLVIVLSLTILGFALAAPLTPFPTEYVRTACVMALLGVIGLTRLRMHAALVMAAVFLVANLVIGIDRGDDLTFLATHGASVGGLTLLALVIAYVLERLRRTDFLSQREAEEERARSDALLHSILPVPIADRLRADRGAIAEAAPEVTVLFSDIVGFTPLSETMSADQLVDLLDQMFTGFDALFEDRNIEKIKTIGDAYMAVSGVPTPERDHAAEIAELAIAMQGTVADLSAGWPTPMQVRIGIASGPVVAGVIGQRKFAYDLWGDTVNTASRMESHGRPGEIQVSESTHTLLRDRYDFSEPSQVDVKGKGLLTTYFLLGRTARAAKTSS